MELLVSTVFAARLESIETEDTLKFAHVHIQVFSGGTQPAT